MTNKILLVIIGTVLASSECAKILGIFPIAAISHNILSYKLMKGLAEAGHDVTMISPYPLKDPPKNGTYTDIILDGFAEEFQGKYFCIVTFYLKTHGLSCRATTETWYSEQN